MNTQSRHTKVGAPPTNKQHEMAKFPSGFNMILAFPSGKYGMFSERYDTLSFRDDRSSYSDLDLRLSDVDTNQSI